MTKHVAPVSRIVRLSILFLKRMTPGLRLIVSFADPHYNHHGGIYQAGNWIYSGDTAPGVEFWHNGKRIHSRQISEKGWNIQHGVKWKTLRPSECKKVETPGKHRYLMPLDAEMRERVLPLAKPYPKRDKQAMTGTTGTAAGQNRPSRSNSLL